MALDSLLASLKNDVSPVAAVQASNGRAFGCNVTATAAVSDVARPGTTANLDTAATAGVSVPYQRETASILGCTAETSATAEKNKVESKARKVGASDTATASRRKATLAEAAELRALVRPCGEPYGFAEADYQEATERALADVDAALLCYRAMAKVERVNVTARPEPDDDRITCLACANLNEFETCRVAHPWTPATACAPARKPVVDLPRRCDGFKAKEGQSNPWPVKCNNVAIPE